MNSKAKNQLLDNLAAWGYPMLGPVSLVRPEKVLKDLLSQNDVRLMEGFPVVLGRALKEKGHFAWESGGWTPQAEGLPERSRRRLPFLLALTVLLFRLFAVDAQYLKRTRKLLAKCRDGERVLKELEGAFVRSGAVRTDGLEFSTERLKNNFLRYMTDAEPDDPGAGKRKQALELDLLLSELFTPRQKELLRKRAEAKEFTKTEREYYYRVVSKRLKALANEELHQMARRLLGR